MKPPFGWVFRAFDQCLLRSASVLVPGEQRSEWQQEWKAELWHVRQACAPTAAVSLKAEEAITAFCLGAFQDALYLRRGSRRKGTRLALMHGSAWHCLFWLAAVLAVSYAIANISAGVIAERHPEHYRVRSNLILIQDAHDTGDWAATIPVERYRSWKRMHQEYFDDLAFYRIQHETLSAGGDSGGVRAVGHGSANLFALLGLSVGSKDAGNSAGNSEPRLIVSYDAWKRDFGSNPHLINSLIRVGERRVRVAGVAPYGAWRLPGEADAWMLEPDSAIAAGAAGYVLAHMTPSVRSEMWNERVYITVHEADGSDEDFWGISFEERTQGPWGIYLFTVMLSFLSLPALTSVAIADYSFSSHQPSWTRNVIRWAFLGGKIIFLLAITYFLSLDLAYFPSTRYSPGASGVQFIFSFFICVFGLRWAVLDQRQRCPVCLRRVTHPARVGLASRTFLAWNGTELMCTGGHTLLHVPGLPTSWFDAPRWVYLDSSWKFLFAE
jgi:hypothetical protein